MKIILVQTYLSSFVEKIATPSGTTVAQPACVKLKINVLKIKGSTHTHTIVLKINAEVVLKFLYV